MPIPPDMRNRKTRMNLSGTSALLYFRNAKAITLKEITTILVQDTEVYYDGDRSRLSGNR
jgi:hypothetical protein